jgi:excisionase family DNA binding protein
MAEQGRRPHRTRAVTPPHDDGRLTYTLTEAAQQLGISTWLAYEAAHRGELPVCRIGRRMLVSRAALLRLLGQDPSSDSESA